MSRPRTLREGWPALERLAVLLWPSLRARSSLLGVAFLTLFGTVGLRLLEPWPLKVVFDHVLITGRHPAAGGTVPVPSGWGPSSPMTVLVLACAGVVLFTGLRAGAEYLNRVGFARIGNGVVGDLRDRVFQHLQDLSLRFHHQARTGDSVLRVINDVNLLRDLAVTALLPAVANVLSVAGMLAVMFWMDWRLALAASLPLPFLWLSTVPLTRRIRDSARKQRSRQSALAATATESITAIKNVQALSLEGHFSRDFGSRSASSNVEDVRTARLTARLGRTVDVLLAVGTALVLGVGAHRVLRGALTAGELLVFLTYLRRAFNPIQDMAKYSGRMAKASAAGERVVDLLDREPEVRDLPGAVAAPRFAGAIRFERVGFGFGDGRDVLRDLSFAIEPAQRVAVVGPSGIGKSTMLDLLLRLYDPIEGAVLIDDRDIRDFTRASLRSQIAVVLQDSLLFAASVRDNIAYGAPDATEDAIEAAARLANAHEFIARLPAGYDAVVGERGVSLSGGERQRIAIARAAVRQAPIMVLDEPTTGLDEANRRSVLEALDRLAVGRTTIVVSHDLDLSARADLVLHVEEGRVIEQGGHDELIERNGRYAELWRTHLGRRREPESARFGVAS